MTEPSTWRWTDSALVATAFTLPLLTMLGSFVLFGAWDLGTWNTIELDWTGWAVVGMLVALVKSRLLLDDLRAAAQLRRGWRYRLGAWWTLSNTLGLFLAFSAWAAVGLLAGQVPTAEVTVGSQDVPASFVSGGLFMLVEAVLLGVLTFGLIARVRLAE